MSGQLSIKEKVLTLSRIEREQAVSTIKVSVDEDGTNYRIDCKECGMSAGKWAKRSRAVDVGVAHWMEEHRG